MQPYALLAWQNFIMEKDEWKPLCHRVGHYTLVNDGLFQRSTNGTLMRCILLDKGCIILQDIHSGNYGSHAGKKYRQGFCWPTTVSNADSFVHFSVGR
jgi:hypothetical protein